MATQAEYLDAVKRAERAERREAKLREALRRTARFNQPATDAKRSNLWPCWCSQERYGYVCRGIMGHDDDCDAARAALAASEEE